MLLAAFSYLPDSLQAQVTARLQHDLVAHGGGSWVLSAPECRQLLTGLNPVLNWFPVENQITLPQNAWQRLLDFARLTPELAGRMLA